MLKTFSVDVVEKANIGLNQLWTTIELYSKVYLNYIRDSVWLVSDLQDNNYNGIGIRPTLFFFAPLKNREFFIFYTLLYI